ncbi:MAG TPA: bifunctional GrpB family protein/GNAT family N-acetyltransferase [Rhabdochlamydiaceae bacterium]|nr:bifunctional GrpB family protein/GNAT family N-acetyltransferase [Rhabdochlamydiaceae bacterium]
MKETRKIEVISYNPLWGEQFQQEKAQITQALGDLCVAVHHVGSTSVPGLAAKPKIDIIAVVGCHPSETVKKLEAIGFEYRGEYNIPMHYGFSKRGKVQVNLHVYEEGHPEIELNLTFRDFLRSHPELRDEYAALKLKLLEDKSSFEKDDSMFTQYNLRKDAFIRKVLKQTGFNRLRFVRCTHYAEWEAAKKMRQCYFFDRHAISDPYQWTFNHKDHIHFVLCRGMDVIGYAHIQLWPEARAAIRIIVVEEKQRNQGFGKQFLSWIETWLKWKGYASIHTESRPDAVHFYKQMGYTTMPFNDPDGNATDPRDTPMGKLL